MSRGQVDQNIAIMLHNVQREAVSAGLMPEGATLTYEKGSSTNGIAPGVWIMPADSSGRRQSPPFLPRFNTKHTGKDVELALDTAYATLLAVNYNP